MKSILLVLLSWVMSAGAFAGEVKISAVDFESAESAPNYFKFIGHSKKLGIIGSSFSGYAKKALVAFDSKPNEISSVVLKIEVAEIDTDNKSRNAKMWDTCLNQKEFPEILVRLKNAIDTRKDSQDVPAEMTVRGKTIPLQIKMEKKSSGEFLGTSSFKLSEAEIPDPSILVASVKDEFEIEFRVNPGEAK